jgi:hypothetical protein
MQVPNSSTDQGGGKGRDLGFNLMQIKEFTN